MGNIKPITLTGACTVATIGAWRDAMLHAIEGEQPAVFDMTGVTSADVTLPQLVLAARQAAGRRKTTFGVAAWSEAALASFARAGIDMDSVMAPFPPAEA